MAKKKDYKTFFQVFSLILGKIGYKKIKKIFKKDKNFRL